MMVRKKKTSWRERELKGVKLREIQRETGVRIHRLREYLRHYAFVRGYNLDAWRTNNGHFVLPPSVAKDFVRWVKKQESEKRVFLVGKPDGSFEIVKG